MKKPVAFNIFFKISNPLYQEIVKTLIEVNQQYKSNFIVDDKVHFPHLSVYLFAAPVKNKSKIIKTAKSFADSIEPFLVKATRVALGEGGLIMVNFEKSDELYRCHLQALKLFNSLREGELREKYQDKKYFVSLSKSDQEKLAQYGHRWILNKYHPHITIAVVKDPASSREIIEKYQNRFKGKTARVIALRIAQEFWKPENKSVLVFDQPLVRKNLDERIKGLLQSREKVKKRLREIEMIFQEEKENEEFWPGHASTKYQAANSDRHVLLDHLSLIETELRKLGYRSDEVK